MKRFIKNTLRFILLLSFIIATSISLIIVWNKSIYTDEYFKLPEDTKYVAFGHSFVARSLNDSLINNLKNYGRPSEGSYFYNRIKVNKILNSNKQIETIFICFSNDQVDKAVDPLITTNLLAQFFPDYFSAIELSDFYELYHYNPKKVLGVLPNTMYKTAIYNLKYTIGKDDGIKNYSRWCGMRDSLERRFDASFADSLVNALKDKPHKELVFDQSITNLEHLRRIISKCKENGVRIIFIRYPLHALENIRENEQYFQEIRTSMFGNIEFLDFVNFPINNDELYDLSHLNGKGAIKFSVFFNELLENGLLEKEDKQAFIEEEMMKYESKYYTEKIN